jgi:transposase
MGAGDLPESKKNARREGAVIVFEDEASFRQTPTLHATWARRGHQPRVPTRGERHTQKIFGAVRVQPVQFEYLHQEDYFAWETYLALVDQVLLRAFYRRGHRVYLIQDNASYHKKKETYDWFAAHRRYLEVFQLPPYWPELNATERIWNYTRKHATHNRYFDQPDELCAALFDTFERVRQHPEEIAGLIEPYVELVCRIIYARLYSRVGFSAMTCDISKPRFCVGADFLQLIFGCRCQNRQREHPRIVALLWQLFVGCHKPNVVLLQEPQETH